MDFKEQAWESYCLGSNTLPPIDSQYDLTLWGEYFIICKLGKVALNSQETVEYAS